MAPLIDFEESDNSDTLFNYIRVQAQLDNIHQRLSLMDTGFKVDGAEVVTPNTFGIGSFLSRLLYAPWQTLLDSLVQFLVIFLVVMVIYKLMVLCYNKCSKPDLRKLTSRLSFRKPSRMTVETDELIPTAPSTNSFQDPAPTYASTAKPSFTGSNEIEMNSLNIQDAPRTLGDNRLPPSPFRYPKL